MRHGEKALEQIEEKKNDIELRGTGVASIIRIGIAFRGKSAAVKQREWAAGGSNE